MEVDQPESERNEFAVIFGGLTLMIYRASILRLKVDTIVNAANESLAHGGGVAYVISEAAGRKLNFECSQYIRDMGRLGVTENMVTTAGNMGRYKGVIHAVGPIWHSYR